MMSTQYRLSHLDPKLANRLYTLPIAALRQVALTSAELAIGASGLQEAVVRDALDLAAAGRPNETDSPLLQSTVDRLDEQYFDLKQAFEDGRTDEGLFRVAFRRARAAAAAMFALSNDSLEAAMDALYEAHAAGVPIESLREVVYGVR